MQIQRIQTLWLLLATIFGGTSLAFGWLKIGAEPMMPFADPMLMVLAALAILMPLIGIFMYRRLAKQKLICRLAAIFALFSVGYIVALSFLGPDSGTSIMPLGPSLMGVSCWFDCLAVNGIVHDEKLLRAADRLR